jgi:putative ABC transport system ATP-binding protein
MDLENRSVFMVKNLRFKGILDISALSVHKPITCIIGASGSGKTTLLRMFNGLNVPDAGCVLYNGDDIAALDKVKLRREVVMLGQTPVIYSGSVEENLQIGRLFSEKEPASVAALEESLRWVELKKKLSDSCYNFSGGEKQRLCLARIMLMNAEVYLLDEPSAALDKETERFIISNLVEFVRRRNKKLIMITHSEQIAETFPDEIIRLEHGQIKGGL